MKQEFHGGLEGLESLSGLQEGELWLPSPSFDRMMVSPKTVSPKTVSSGSSEVSYNNALSENAIEALRRQQDQNKLIHLDPIPDFKDKSEVKPWLQKIFYPQGIEIVIERSDSMKIVFKCKAVKKPRGGGAGGAGGCCGHAHEGACEGDPGASGKRKRSSGQYNSCPFRVRATFSLKRKKWNIVVVNNVHTHPLKFNPDSEDYKKFKKGLVDSGDVEAVKKFDELEYRTKFNLPIDLSPIPCDCGLTQEIQSFNIVLPSTNIINPGSRAGSSSSFLESGPAGNSHTVTKPKKAGKKALKNKTTKQLTRKSTKKKLQRDIESSTSAHTSRTTTPLSALPNSLNLQFDSSSNMSTHQPASTPNIPSHLAITPQENFYNPQDFIPTTASSHPMDSPNFSNLNSNYFNVQNEIDFTEFFSKPLPHFKNAHRDVITTHGTIPLTFSHKHPNNNSQILNTQGQMQSHQLNTHHNLIYHNPGSASSTNSSPNMNMMASAKTPGTINTPNGHHNVIHTAGSVPLYSSNLMKEPIHDFVDMNEIFGSSTSTNNNHSDSHNNGNLHQNSQSSLLSSRALNFKYANQHQTRQNVSALCELNNFDVCAQECGGLGTSSLSNATTIDSINLLGTCNDDGNGNRDSVKTEFDAESQEYISKVLNSNFNELKLSQNELNGHEQQGDHQMNAVNLKQDNSVQSVEGMTFKEDDLHQLVANAEDTYQLNFGNDVEQSQQSIHNPQILWDEPHGFF